MVGISLTCVGLSMALVQALLIGKVVTRFGERKTAMIGLCFATSVMVFYAFNKNGAITIAICFVVGIQGMVMPSINALMSRRTPDNMQGELQGFNGSLAALAALIAPLIYNTSLSFFTSPDAPFEFTGMPFILSSLLGAAAMLVLGKTQTNTKLSCHAVCIVSVGKRKPRYSKGRQLAPLLTANLWPAHRP